MGPAIFDYNKRLLLSVIKLIVEQYFTRPDLRVIHRVDLIVEGEWPDTPRQLFDA